MKQRTVKIIYWIVTALFLLAMTFSGISEIMQTPEGNDLLIKLGYPLYLNFILGIAKVLGVLAILQPRFHALREWAYAGFTIDLIGASASFAFSGFSFGDIIGPVVPLLFMFTSYFLGRKLGK